MFDKPFKDAISRLPSAEKDKLIFRLLKKDLDLANRLLFELVSSDSQEDRRREAKKRIDNMIAKSRNRLYSSPGILLMEMKNVSGVINEHVNITKDKYGEVYLQLFVLNEYLQMYNDHFKDASPGKSYTFNLYLVAKVFKIMILLKKMHEEILVDFANDLEKAGRLFGDNPGLMNAARYNGLDVNWLIENKIPDNIAEREKDLRQNGYLK
jgi:hypothetical protein